MIRNSKHNDSIDKPTQNINSNEDTLKHVEPVADHGVVNQHDRVPSPVVNHGIDRGGGLPPSCHLQDTLETRSENFRLRKVAVWLDKVPELELLPGLPVDVDRNVYFNDLNC